MRKGLQTGAVSGKPDCGQQQLFSEKKSVPIGKKSGNSISVFERLSVFASTCMVQAYCQIWQGAKGKCQQFRDGVVENGQRASGTSAKV